MERYSLCTSKGHGWTNAERTKDCENKTYAPVYQTFVLSGIKTESPLKAIKRQLFLD
ncbi:MAG: hypothetical protein P9L89_08430 [Candidatus Celaenobacter polaris]|nr:hypothetical protein [Candidatus Celaenobacter polaris]